MGQIADITNLSDGEATPVAHNFAVAEVKPGYVKYEDRSSGIPAAYNVLEIWVKKPRPPEQPLGRVRMRLTYPVMEVVTASTYNGITPAPTVAYRTTSEVLHTYHNRSTLLQRRNPRKLLENLQASLIGTALIDNLETLY